MRTANASATSWRADGTCTNQRRGRPGLRHRTLRPGTPPGQQSRFEDAVWHLGPAHPDAHAKINAIR